MPRVPGKKYPSDLLESKREYYKKNRDRIISWRKQRRLENIEEFRMKERESWNKRKKQESHKRYIANKRKAAYGITQKEFDGMAKEQDYKCDICGMPFSDLTRAPSVDHSHVTKNVRGLLCNKCNLGLGYFNDSPVNLRRAAEYLIDNQES